MSTTLLPFQPEMMTPAQQAAVSYLARYRGHTHALYTYQLRRWFACARPVTSILWLVFSVRTSGCTSDSWASPG